MCWPFVFVFSFIDPIPSFTSECKDHPLQRLVLHTAAEHAWICSADKLVVYRQSSAEVSHCDTVDLYAPPPGWRVKANFTHRG